MRNEFESSKESHSHYKHFMSDIPFSPTSTDVSPTESALMTLHLATSEMTKVLKEIRKNNRILIQPLQDVVFPAVQMMSSEPGIFNLILQLGQKDDYTSQHSIAVAILSLKLGRALNLSFEDQTDLLQGAVLHDIGKLRIPDEILNKPTSLTHAEYEEMKRHTVYGYELIERTGAAPEVQARIALEHHERLNGSGYPYNKKDDEIHPLSKIVSVIDSFHAMSSMRVYRDQIPFYEILVKLHHDMFGMFDPLVTLTFLRMMMNELVGTHVELSNGERGVIKVISPQAPTLPMIEVGQTVIDLSQMTGIKIVRIVE